MAESVNLLFLVQIYVEKKHVYINLVLQFNYNLLAEISNNLNDTSISEGWKYSWNSIVNIVNKNLAVFFYK